VDSDFRQFRKHTALDWMFCLLVQCNMIRTPSVLDMGHANEPFVSLNFVTPGRFPSCTIHYDFSLKLAVDVRAAKFCY
jgi:hypothetical protein